MNEILACETEFIKETELTPKVLVTSVTEDITASQL